MFPEEGEGITEADFFPHIQRVDKPSNDMKEREMQNFVAR